MHKTFTLPTLLLLSSFFACGGAPDDGAAADSSALAELALPDSASESARLAGVFHLAGPAHARDEIAWLHLTADGRFAWTRCYDATCAAPVREDGTFQLTRTASGRRYIRFQQRGAAGDAALHLNSIYAYSASSDRSRLSLRRASSARTFQLSAIAEPEICASSGGSWQGASRACDCGAAWPMAYAPGAGGCWRSPAAGETQCDDTQGSWTDDDADLAGTYCQCGIGRHLTEAGCVDNHF